MSKSTFCKMLETKKYIQIQINDTEAYAYTIYEDMIRDFPEFEEYEGI